ncbi:MAG: hypothetical protein HY758_10070 [Nitrospirae bacterium]|nr:hypothetical protein [Nitrospirota bacterium]
MVKRGWNVKVLTSNRFCRYPQKKIEVREAVWNGINIIRSGRPGWNQANKYLRIANSFWIMIAWSFKMLRMPQADVVIVGSDPQFSQFLLPVLHKFRKQRFLCYWCYDLYPEAIIADGAKGLTKWFAEKIKIFVNKCYRNLDLLVDIGPCMQKRLKNYKHTAIVETLTPWALVEPQQIGLANPEVRYKLFGDAELALLYSGNMGKAHDYNLFLQLARMVYRANPKIIFCFSCRGNRFDELKKAIKYDDYNIRVVPFSYETELEERLIAADLHLLSLRPECPAARYA